MNAKKKNVFVIINPISGTRSKANIPDMIADVLDKDKFIIEIAFTAYAGHATELARKAVENKVDYVIAVGGDGTINETAKALVHTNTTLGIIPLGSGNGLARHLDIPLEIRRALRVINQEKCIKIDYCKANDHIFFTTCGVGFDALISLKFSQDKTRGGITYIKNVLFEYLKYKPETYELVIEEESIKEKAFLIACANASQYGNNAYIAPHASMQDGKMNITLIKPFNYLDAGTIAFQLFTKLLDKNSKIESFSKNNIIIRREKPGIMHIDGEPIEMGTEIKIKTYHSGLNILVPDRRYVSLMVPLQHVIGDIAYAIRTELKYYT